MYTTNTQKSVFCVRNGHVPFVRNRSAGLRVVNWSTLINNAIKPLQNTTVLFQSTMNMVSYSMVSLVYPIYNIILDIFYI